MNWVFTILLIIASMGFIVSSYAEEKGSFSPYVDSEGNIERPADFRENWTYLGSWVHPEDDKSGFHNVYTELGVAEKYKETGKFPDGAVLVKEVLAEGTQDMTTGKGVVHAKDDIVLWFVMGQGRKRQVCR